jgi:hypothetical protein
MQPWWQVQFPTLQFSDIGGASCDPMARPNWKCLIYMAESSSTHYYSVCDRIKTNKPSERSFMQLEATRSIVHGRNLKRIAKLKASAKGESQGQRQNALKVLMSDESRNSVNCSRMLLMDHCNYNNSWKWISCTMKSKTFWTASLWSVVLGCMEVDLLRYEIQNILDC